MITQEMLDYASRVASANLRGHMQQHRDDVLQEMAVFLIKWGCPERYKQSCRYAFKTAMIKTFGWSKGSSRDLVLNRTRPFSEIENVESGEEDSSFVDRLLSKKSIEEHRAIQKRKEDISYVRELLTHLDASVSEIMLEVAANGQSPLAAKRHRCHQRISQIYIKGLVQLRKVVYEQQHSAGFRAIDRLRRWKTYAPDGSTVDHLGGIEKCEQGSSEPDKTQQRPRTTRSESRSRYYCFGDPEKVDEGDHQDSKRLRVGDSARDLLLSELGIGAGVPNLKEAI